MQIRFAQPQDAEALYQLNTLFNGHNCNSAKQIHAFLSAPHEEIILLAQEKLSSIGFCCAQLCRSFCYNAPTGIISELYVLPEYHRQGIATALLTAAEAELARRAGILHDCTKYLELDEQLAPVISNYGTTVVTDTVTDADLLAALTAAGLTGEQQQAVLGAVGVAMGKALQNDTPAMVQGVAGTVSGVLMGQLGSGISQLQTGVSHS